MWVFLGESSITEDDLQLIFQKVVLKSNDKFSARSASILLLKKLSQY